jgi:threonine synthase
MTYVTGLRCHACGTTFRAGAVWVCDQCLGPLGVVYDYDRVRRDMSRERVARRPANLWRYRELLPIEGDPRTGFHSGMTPLVRSTRLAGRLGLSELYIKDDSVNHPTLSYKDRVVSVAISRGLELGFDVFACASTGNLANSVAAHAARVGAPSYVFVPHDLEAAKILGSAIYRPIVVSVQGSYDDVNRLCTQVADRSAEGAKTMGFEIAEQLGWRLPDHVVLPVAGGTLLPRVAQAFRELVAVGLVEADRLPRIHAVQAEGSAPVVRALLSGSDEIQPVKPRTIASSLAIGNPADGPLVLDTVRALGGTGAIAPEAEVLGAIQLLAETEGIFTEVAGGTTLAGARALIEQGVIGRDESVVVCITGNGYKTAELLTDRVAQPLRIGRSLADAEAALGLAATQGA